MEIKIVAEASTRLQRLFIGWGVSFLVDNDILFDTFSNSRILKINFKRQNVNISDIKYVVISHEHWDHTGGLWYILSQNPKVKVFICPNFDNKFKDKLKNFNTQVYEVQKLAQIKENIFTTGEISGEYNKKPISEQSLIIKNHEHNISIITGCAHPGIVEIVKKVKEFSPSTQINLLLGGFHLNNKCASEMSHIINELKSLDVEKVAPCHCTGSNAVKLFQKEFKENFIKIHNGIPVKIE